MSIETKLALQLQGFRPLGHGWYARRCKSGSGAATLESLTVRHTNGEEIILGSQSVQALRNLLNSVKGL